MPPAGSDDLFQHSRSLGDNIPFPQDPSRPPQEHEPSGKNKKKGKNGSKGKDKAAKAATKTPTPAEDLYVSSVHPPSRGSPLQGFSMFSGGRSLTSSFSCTGSILRRLCRPNRHRVQIHRSIIMLKATSCRRF